MRKITTYIIAIFAILLIFSSCKKEYETIEELDNTNLQAYKAAHANLTFKDTAGYSYSISPGEIGTGGHVVNSDSVYYSYTFKSVSGTVYNQTSELMVPATLLGYTDRFAIGSTAYVFKPIREVLAKLQRGGKATLILPSRMAFGKNGLTTFNIGSNETIVVELGLYTFKHRHKADDYEIAAFKTKNNLTNLIGGENEVRYTIITPGTGTEEIKEHSTLIVNYTGRYLDGTVFDAGTGVTFRLDQLIKGWQVVLPGKIKAGGKARLVIPSYLGYGSSPLDFDIEVTSVTND